MLSSHPWNSSCRKSWKSVHLRSPLPVLDLPFCQAVPHLSILFRSRSTQSVRDVSAMLIRSWVLLSWWVIAGDKNFMKQKIWGFKGLVGEQTNLSAQGRRQFVTWLLGTEGWMRPQWLLSLQYIIKKEIKRREKVELLTHSFQQQCSAYVLAILTGELV